MSQEYSYFDAVKEHREAQGKFDYFFLGVVVTLLSLSIQTFKQEDEGCLFLMIVTWSLLLSSFLSGLYRQVKIVTMLGSEAEFLGYKTQINPIEDALREGETFVSESTGEKVGKDKILQRIELLKKGATVHDEHRKKSAKRSWIAYVIQKWTFVLSILSFILFKAANFYPQLAALMKCRCW